ncbi:hypothetical protein [Vogesella sp. LIG4]|uniref:hypothetical protein n=1 Tax=Vogesella sp. LIG4 TaxID=1192162 RepID=UPI00081F7623|nr:hypothetical protein [Vogesella sp. LIG4]SCK25240.1 hypothetical protein PSELUDRAFT_2994 [Vogesella sp. LIG4]
MTDPKQSDNGWNLQDLPVLTDVVAESDDELEVPAFDFSAELDELARSLPPKEPELELPPELTLDDVLGAPEDAGDASALDASKLIESLPSLDLEVDMPGDLSLDDVLPSPAPAAAPPAPAAEGEDFTFDLPAGAAGEATPLAAEAGLDALFARARFEPLLAEEALAAEQPAAPADHHAELAALHAELEHFAEPVEMPELPADAFLTQTPPEATLIPAAEPDPVWAESWQPAAAVAEEEAQPALPPALAEPAAAEAAADSFHVSLDDLLQSLQPAQEHAAPLSAGEPPLLDAVIEEVGAPPAHPQAGEPLAGTVADGVADDVAAAASADDFAANVSDADWPLADEAAAAAWSPEPLAVADAPSGPGHNAAEPHLVEPPLVEVEPPVVEAPVAEAATEAAAELADDDGWPPEEGEDTLVAVEGADADAFAEPAAAPAEPAAEAEMAAMPHSISLDSLPTGVLGGGLGLAAAAAAAAAAAHMGASASSLPGGEAWPLRSQLRGDSERDVELDWARDLHTEPPQGAALQDEPEAMVMRSRRTVVDDTPGAAAPRLEDIPFHPVAASESPLVVSPPFTMAPAAEAPAIRVEAVTPPLEAGPVLGGVDEGALIEALYQRVLPRMKVELTLWMQDALEQQAKQLISGVMQQMKEDFDMMLAQSLKESLREALDEVAPRHGKDN